MAIGKQLQRRKLLPLVLVAALGALFGPACASPTLPLPPPSVSSIHPSDANGTLWTITGDCVPGALVTAFNETTGEGRVVEDRDLTGRFAIPLKGSLCDLGWVKQEQSTEPSSRTGFVIAERDENGPIDPGACQPAQ